MTVRVKRIKGEGDTLQVRIFHGERETSSRNLYHLFPDGHSKLTGNLIGQWIRSLRRMKEDVTVTIENTRRPSR